MKAAFRIMRHLPEDRSEIMEEAARNFLIRNRQDSSVNFLEIVCDVGDEKQIKTGVYRVTVRDHAGDVVEETKLEIKKIKNRFFIGKPIQFREEQIQQERRRVLSMIIEK